ncbi:hypothetical protein GCM10010168_44160 [Actinoplanes ianthinogenes]|uniref:Uncharacterized protein n=1 Tax=Actinoplanes ianthinogenes TaxID=122358 RepID=A0ABN6CCC4_9ACTN|nr:hypothetical protein [Actinoplanes ianthinogenes]BCJ43275.1 hypothetical protein Aiant_39320 [Actinoplanes ianthinogenes]GGR21253.1 hypothetical protein GCM10010168_44160 [Actinoplanes ianthinogenes]
MATESRFKTAPGAGTLAAFLLVLIFGSPWYGDWVNSSVDGDTGLGWWLRLLHWPAWKFDSGDSLRGVIVGDLRAILVVVLTLVFLILLPGSQLARARGTISQFLAGWAAYIFAGAFAALLAMLFFTDPSLLGAMRASSSGATYGLFIGWIVGLATLGGRRGAAD